MRIASAPGAVLLATLLFCAGQAMAAGIQRIEVPGPDGAAPLEGAVWTPCAQPDGVVKLRSVTVPGVRDCPIAGEHLPLIVISHGARGWFGGHHDTAEALADAGFVVAAITHPDAPGRAWQSDRPAAVKRLIDYLLEDWSGHGHLDGARIGFFGFSRGGYTGLVLIGGTPDFRLAAEHCRAVPDDALCRLEGPPPTAVPAPSAAQPAGERRFVHDPRIRAAVIAAPLGLVFSRDGLKDVTVPVQLWRPENDTLASHPYNAEAIYQRLPRKPEYHVVENAGHFAMLAPCTPPQAAAVPALCNDAGGFDRTAFHRDLNTAILGFFRQTLGVQ